MSDSKEVAVRDASEVEVSTGPEVNALLELAINKGVDVETLERLFELEQRVTERNARGAFFAALNAFQDDCPDIEQTKSAKIATKSGRDYEYTYAPLDEITRTIRPVLREHGLAYSWTTEQSDRADFLHVVCVLRHIDGHEERAVFPVPTATQAAMSGAQKQGAALTYGRRQSLVSVLGLTVSDDVDGAGQAQPIDSDQIKTINELITAADVDFRAFYEYLEIEALDDLTVGDYQKAINALTVKIAKKNKEAAG